MHREYTKNAGIEIAFRSLKSSGFNIEDTHLTDIDRIDKLFALVIVAFTWAYKVGIYVHSNIKDIKIKNYGRRKTKVLIQTRVDNNRKHFAKPQ
jgi:hypothetical protein